MIFKLLQIKKHIHNVAETTNDPTYVHQIISEFVLRAFTLVIVMIVLGTAVFGVLGFVLRQPGWWILFSIGAGISIILLLIRWVVTIIIRRAVRVVYGRIKKSFDTIKPMHAAVQEIKDTIDQSGYEYHYFEHEPVRTSEEAAVLHPDYTLSQGAKALLIRAKKNGENFFVQVVVPGDVTFDVKKLKDILDAKKISFATKPEADNITKGIEFGGIPPFGNLFGIPVYVDKALFKNDKIIFNCGDRRASIGMSAVDWAQIVQPIVIDVAS